MDVKQLDANYSVSDQITVSDVQTLKEQGVSLLICNRPDGEAEGQTPFAEIERAALELGLEIVNIPFVGGQLKLEQVVAFKEQLDRGIKTHAYCRTGNRCTIIWEESKKL